MSYEYDYELEKNFKLSQLNHDEEVLLDESFGRDFEENQNVKEFQTPKYISSDPRLRTLAEIILDEAIALGTTDVQIIHLNANIGIVRLRVGEEMYPYRRIRGSAMRGLAIVIKAMSEVNIEEEGLGQGGRFPHEYDGVIYNIRSSFMPSIHGETISLRILYGNRLGDDVRDLGLPEQIERTLQQVLRLNEGLVLLTGGTGSGKTTTMYTSIGHIQRENMYTKNVITIEDPVEYVIPGASQSQVNAVKGYGFAEGLQTALRQNPDIILVGEINSDVTAQTAVRASTSGHLVFSTFHSNSPLTVPIGMEHFNVSKFNLNSALTLVLTQTRPNKLCDVCKTQKMVTPEESRWIKSLGVDQDILVIYEANPEGCSECGGIGYKDRVLCASMLDVNSVYHKIITDMEGLPINQIEEKLRATEGSNYYAMEQDVHRHLRLGNIDLETAKRILR